MKRIDLLKTQRGFSFIELTLVLAILAVSAVAAQQIVLARAEQKIIDQSVDGIIKVTEAVYAHYADSPPAARTWPPSGNVQSTDWSAWEDYLPLGFAGPENYWFQRTHETAGDPTTRVVGGIVSRRMGTEEQVMAVSAALGTDYCGPSACSGQQLAILNSPGHFPASHAFGQPGSDDAIEQTLTSPEFQTLVLERNPDFVAELIEKIKQDDDFMAELTGDDGDDGTDGNDGNDGNGKGGNGNDGNKPSPPQPKTTCLYNGAERVSGWSYYRWSGTCTVAYKSCGGDGDNCAIVTYNGTESGTQTTCRSGRWSSAARTRGCTYSCEKCTGGGGGK